MKINEDFSLVFGNISDFFNIYIGTVVATQLRNIAIIAHVDHGKTTLVDKLLQQTASVSKKSNQY